MRSTGLNLMTIPAMPRKVRAITITRLTKSFKQDSRTVNIFHNMSLDVSLGDVVSVLGGSGCGKTTLLNLIAGVDRSYEGSINTYEYTLGYMFQTDLLLPWRNARDNALLCLEVNGKAHNEEKISLLNEYFRRLDLEDFMSFYPDKLSGGMRQRVALIRTLLREPDILLLDEPFSALDYDAKLFLEKWVLDFARKLERTIVFVTHDIDEAIAVGNRLVVLDGDQSRDGCTKIALDMPVTFNDDRVGRDPIAARQDSQFPDYFKHVWSALRGS